MTNSIEQSLEQRLKKLEALEAIKRLKHDYFYWCDTKQPAKVKGCFVDGLVNIDYGAIGTFDNRNDMVEVFAKAACGENADYMVETHHAQNPRIDIIDDYNAKGTWGLFYYLIQTQQQTVTQLCGIYQDEYKKVDGQWLISSTVFKPNSTLVTDISEAQINKIFAGKVMPM